MKRLACLVILAVVALPCSADGPRADHTSKKPPRPKPMATVGGQLVFTPNNPPAPPEPLISARLVRTVLFPDQTLIRWGLDRFRSRRFVGNVIGLQIPGTPTPDLDIPSRCTSFGGPIPPFPGR